MDILTLKKAQKYTDNLIITSNKTNFVYETRNMFKGEYLPYYLSGAENRIVTISSESRFASAIVPVLPNTTYTVSKDIVTSRFIVGCFEKYPADGDYCENRIINNGGTSITITTGENDFFLLVYVSNDGITPNELQIEEGDRTPFVPPYMIKNTILGVDKVFEPSKKPNITVVDNPVGNYSSTLVPYVENYENNVHNVYAHYDSLMSQYPDYISKTLLGEESTSNLPIYRYDFRPANPRNSVDGDPIKILCVSGIHGQEKVIVASGALFFEDLAVNWKENDVLRMLRWNVHFIVIPVLNPWGYNNNERKNGRGIDLNRNFPNNFIPGTDPSSPDYAGTEPLSEVESQIIADLIDQNNDIMFAIDAHNYNHYPSSASDLFWFNSSTQEVVKLLMGLSNYINAKLKKEYPDKIEQGNNSVVSVRNTYPTNGRLAHYFHHRNIAGAILEAVTGFTGGSGEDIRKITMEVYGELFLTAIRNINAINRQLTQ